MKIKLLILMSIMVSSLGANSCQSRLFTIDSKDLTISKFLNYMAQECSLGVLYKDRYAKDLAESSNLNLYLKDVTLNELLEITLKENKLAYEFNNKIIKVSYEVSKTFTLDYISGTRTGKSTTNIDLSSGVGTTNVATANSGSGGTAGGGSNINIESGSDFNVWTQIKTDIEEILKSSNSDGNMSGYQPTVFINEGAGFINVTGNIEQIDRIEHYINEISKKLTNQVLIDVTILNVTLNHNQKTGIDWGQLQSILNVGVDYSLGYGDSRKRDGNKETVGIVNNGNGGSNSLSLSLSDAPTPSTGLDGTTSTTAGGSEIQSEFNANPALLNGQKVYDAKSILNSSSFAISGNVNFNEVIRFLKTQGDVKSVSNPKVLTLNNQPAIISVGEQIFYRTIQVTSTTTQATQTNTATSIENVFTGVLLDITPTITNSNEIILKINPSISSPRNDIAFNGNIREMPPDISKKQLNSVVKVKDEDKIIIGGLINTTLQDDESKVPFLGDIPLVGNLFRQDTKGEVISELVIIITPHIIKSDKAPSLKDLGYNNVE